MQLSLPLSMMILLPLFPDPLCAFTSLSWCVPRGTQLAEGLEGRWGVPGHNPSAGEETLAGLCLWYRVWKFSSKHLPRGTYRNRTELCEKHDSHPVGNHDI